MFSNGIGTSSFCIIINRNEENAHHVDIHVLLMGKIRNFVRIDDYTVAAMVGNITTQGH